MARGDPWGHRVLVSRTQLGTKSPLSLPAGPHCPSCLVPKSSPSLSPYRSPGPLSPAGTHLLVPGLGGSISVGVLAGGSAGGSVGGSVTHSPCPALLLKALPWVPHPKAAKHRLPQYPPVNPCLPPPAFSSDIDSSSCAYLPSPPCICGGHLSPSFNNSRVGDVLPAHAPRTHPGWCR